MAGAIQSIALWSPKGGVGKSVLAVALALRLAERQRTVLIDGNPDNPDVTSLLQCPGQPNVTGWTPPEEPADLESLFVRHSNRLWVLPGPPRYVEEGALSGPVMESVLHTCRRAGFTAVVDLGTPLRDSTVVALDRADRVLVPVTPDLLAVAPLRRLRGELELLRMPESKFRVVVNRVSTSREVTVEDIQGFSDFALAGVVPSSRELAAAVNRGEIGVALGRETPVGKAVASLAEPFMEEGILMPVRRRRAWGGLLLGLRRGGS